LTRHAKPALASISHGWRPGIGVQHQLAGNVCFCRDLIADSVRTGHQSQPLTSSTHITLYDASCEDVFAGHAQVLCS
jgi:hypothetical protein